ncbi:MAG: hypothetical protein J7458_19040, partial [Caldilinea sp.]|nr:hypothetical protein [Caldilinea sp.]
MKEKISFSQVGVQEFFKAFSFNTVAQYNSPMPTSFGASGCLVAADSSRQRIGSVIPLEALLQYV